jgi:segregation and condensation protein B
MTKTDRKNRKKHTTGEAQASAEATAATDDVDAVDTVDTVDAMDPVDAADHVDAVDAVDTVSAETPPEESTESDSSETSALSTQPSLSTSSPSSGEPPVSSDEPSAPSDAPPAFSVARIESLDFTSPAAPEEEEPEAEPLETDLETAAVEEIREGEEAPFQSPAEIKAAIECLLFTTPHPLPQQKIRQLVGGIDLRTLRGILVQLQAEYDARGSGLMVIEGAEGFQMCTRPQYADVVLHLHRQRKKNPLSPTALETLAIIAYKQPMTRAEIEMIRGVESSGVLRNLADMGLVEVVGRKEVIGRPQLYGTTAVFLRMFGLRSLAELPTIQNLRRQFEAPTMSMFGGGGGAQAPIHGYTDEPTDKDTDQGTDREKETGEAADKSADEPADKDTNRETDEVTDAHEPADESTVPDSAGRSEESKSEDLSEECSPSTPSALPTPEPPPSPATD